MFVYCLLIVAGGMLSGCSSTGERREPVSASVAEVEQGMLGDLNQYIQQLLQQQQAGNAEAEKVLVRLLAGKGLPVSEAAATGR
ncbi:hypothetical protein O4O00_21860 [Citrobacter sedlakii]|uniref:hypothetical protein n=1 Tax=Citrobacter sedlakii TaxID=67826 RepID=UPI0022B4C478|nr:hypothetical protein [Citrobacter sedlakii]MCZ4677002.1 hypothetical protein [Citrobacter sedlakii]MDR5007059.1 hypothetical protein [Citrobacter sedlakii]